MLSRLFLRNCNSICLPWYWLCFLLINFAAGVAGQDLSSQGIPDDMRNGSKAVIRYRKTNFEIISVGKARLQVDYAMTILNESGIDNAKLILFYDKFSRISGVRGTIYNSEGRKVERIDKDKILDRSAISGYSIYEDNRVIYFSPEYRTVPFTVEYSYEIVYNGILDYPDYFLVNDYDIAVENAVFTITANADEKLRYLEKNIGETCNITKDKSKINYNWTFSHISPVRHEILSPPVLDFIPSILIAPNNFELKNQSGNAESWENFGKWIYELTRDRDQLSDETVKKIRDLAGSVSDPYEKISLIYQYFQNKTRYASIQIGLGGWQPFDAETVDRLSYGDCKALSNYMQALLSAADIPSYYTLVKAGANASDIVTDFPSNQFNHVIINVPIVEDTLWLECTNQNIPMGYLGTFTDDRSVLIITENGGILGHTCTYDENDNVRSRVCFVTIEDNGSGVTKLTSRYQGIYYDEMVGIYRSDDQDKKKAIEKKIPAGNFSLHSFHLDEYPDRIPAITEELELTLQQLGVNVNDMMLFQPNQFSRIDPPAQSFILRKNPMDIRRSVTECDTVYYSFPDNFTFEGSHLDEKISSEFGEYHASTAMIGNKLCYSRQLVLHKGKYSADRYYDYVDFMDKIAYADSKKVALKPKSKLLGQ